MLGTGLKRMVRVARIAESLRDPAGNLAGANVCSRHRIPVHLWLGRRCLSSVPSSECYHHSFVGMRLPSGINRIHFSETPNSPSLQALKVPLQHTETCKRLHLSFSNFVKVLKKTSPEEATLGLHRVFQRVLLKKVCFKPQSNSLTTLWERFRYDFYWNLNLKSEF